MTVTRALLSVSDKAGLVDFARGLVALGIELLSTGGTHALLAKEGIAVRQVSEFTGAPEMLGGRVKTLHPKVHGGILARRELAEDQADMAAQGVLPIDLVVVNLYPFREAVAKGLPHEEVIENIDIGGPSMLRSAGKNAKHVAVVVDPADYAPVLAELQAARSVSDSTRARLQAKAFGHTAAYDAAIAAYLAEQLAKGPAQESKAPDAPVPAGWSETPPIGEYKLVQSLRYGENPHQKAAFYGSMPAPKEPSLAQGKQLQGKELSFNNILDASAALEALKEFARGPDGTPAVVVVKHTNPCGVARGKTLAEAYKAARDADPVSAFGGIAALTHVVDEATAKLLAETFFEVIVAPGFSPEAQAELARKKALRLLELPLLGLGRKAWVPESRELRSIPGGLLVQSRDLLSAEPTVWKTVTKRAPTEQELATLTFAWNVCKHVKSNAIVLAQPDVTVGIGMGQTNRVDSVRIAVTRAGDRAKGSVLAGDAFFPFPDGLIAAIEGGVTAVAQPGGSVRDAEVIAAADERGVAMVFTGARHFRH
ncbi:MAG: bifunctional phosphoribosylaminoimidazolecarboxamide formyltransferase/IMP cyclohydrolase [Deltaproteobacteria bacterium]|nr:bifunctional phosphoribosylaminoimidazolecarboxamide formyltransferase/IMP cyclohydrolase [Deltaproteobacteria bacterium]